MVFNIHQARMPEEEIMRSRRFAPRPTRRNVLAGALAAGTGLIVPRSVFAQDSAATPAVLTEAITSQNREEFRAEIEEELGYTDAATPGGTFIDSNINDIQTIHPLLADDASSLSVVGKLYDQLVGGDVRTGGPGPNGLADYWEIAPDGRTYTFHLNQDAKWHDGTDITAEDVQFSFDALANLEVGSAYTQSFLDAAESWRVIDEHTFEVVAREPLFTFLYDLVTWIVPKHIWESVPVADWRTDGGATGQDPSRVVGSGPWRFQEWRQGESVTLVRNDDYYDKVPYIDSYVIRIWPDQTSIVNALVNGEMDAAGLEPADVATVKATEGLVVATYPTRGFSFYMTNLDPEKTTLFVDQPVRQALLHGLDRESIVKDILLGNAEVAQGTRRSYWPKLVGPIVTATGSSKKTGRRSRSSSCTVRARRRAISLSPTCKMPGERLVSKPRLVRWSSRPSSRRLPATTTSRWPSSGSTGMRHSSRMPCSPATSTRVASIWSSTATRRSTGSTMKRRAPLTKRLAVS
jgi:ABC-type transport system substrate-binding protein